MLKSEFAEWIRQVVFPVHAYNGVGAIGSYYRDRTNASLRLGGVAFRLAAELWADLARWHEARRAAAALRACSDETLRDIGLDRSEINSIVYMGGKTRRRGYGHRD